MCPPSTPRTQAPRDGVRGPCVPFSLRTCPSRRLTLPRWPWHPPSCRKAQVLLQPRFSCAQSQAFPLRGDKGPTQGETHRPCPTFCPRDLCSGHLAVSGRKMKRTSISSRMSKGGQAWAGLLCEGPRAHTLSTPPSAASVPEVSHGPGWLLKHQQLCPRFGHRARERAEGEDESWELHT